MHDKLFANQATWSNLGDAKPTFKQYAAELKLNTSSFDTCLDSAKYKDEVQKDMADGIAAGINGTPGFWVVGADGKGQLISGAVPFATFKQAIDALL
jgi:protein-disulfide isomerase